MTVNMFFGTFYLLSFFCSLVLMISQQYEQSKRGKTIKLFDIFESVFLSMIPAINTLFFLMEFKKTKVFYALNIPIFKGKRND